MPNTDIPYAIAIPEPEPDHVEIDYEAIMQQNYEEMIEVTNELDLWDWFATANPPENQGFMYWTHPNLAKFRNLMNQKGYLDKHSGASYAICLRRIQSDAIKQQA